MRGPILPSGREPISLWLAKLTGFGLNTACPAA
jgi:hypothetical protein